MTSDTKSHAVMDSTQGVSFRSLSRDEIALFRFIDRREEIEGIYYHGKDGLFMAKEHHEVGEWSEKFKDRMIAKLNLLHVQGATFLGAMDGDRLVGMAVLDHQEIASGQRRLNLTGLWVSSPFRNRGIGRVLFLLAADEARERGASSMYISATPSENTVRFYRRLGCQPANPVDPELLEKEPDDIHLEYPLFLDPH